MLRDIQMEDPSTTVLDHEEAIQHAKRHSGHGEEIHGYDDVAVIAKESNPAFAGVVGRGQAPEIARNSAFRDVESEFQKLTVNSRSAPGGKMLSSTLSLEARMIAGTILCEVKRG